MALIAAIVPVVWILVVAHQHLISTVHINEVRGRVPGLGWNEILQGQNTRNKQTLARTRPKSSSIK